MSLNPCLTCGRPTANGAYCEEHEPERRSTTERGYDGPHKRRRAELLPVAIGTPCPLCHEPMLKHQALDLDHTVPLAIDATSKGDRIVHASCNVAHANRARGAGLPIFEGAHRPDTGAAFPRAEPVEIVIA